MGIKAIRECEERINERVLKRFLAMNKILLLGNNLKPKATIYSFLVKTHHGKFLNPNFVVSLLNDLFGIQSRAGCLCAALYG